uniref:HTH_Tnp_Tc3_1 domain-containing protein n=1 Tax=Caenorhabditis japonica TaxID=281687 RepID=A0A8R1EKL9_CAEJA
MGRGKTLTMPERAQVGLMVQLNMSISLMSARIHCSRTLNNCYISDPVAYGTSKSTGRARKLKQRYERTVARAVSNTMKSAKDNGKQYNSISELKDAVKAEWSKIHPSYLENLSNSMPNRIFQVIQKNGGVTSY